MPWWSISCCLQFRRNSNSQSVFTLRFTSRAKSWQTCGKSRDFHLIPQYKYDLFHIYFTWFHCTGRNELNKLTLLPMCGSQCVAQLVEHRTGIAEVMGSNPVEALIFFRLLLSNCLNWKIYCDDHTSLSSHTAVQIWFISYIFHKSRETLKFWNAAISKYINLIFYYVVQKLSIFNIYKIWTGVMWSTLKISSGAQLGHDKWDIPAFKWCSNRQIVLSSGPKISKTPLKRRYW